MKTYFTVTSVDGSCCAESSDPSKIGFSDSAPYKFSTRNKALGWALTRARYFNNNDPNFYRINEVFEPAKNERITGYQVQRTCAVNGGAREYAHGTPGKDTLYLTNSSDATVFGSFGEAKNWVDSFLSRIKDYCHLDLEIVARVELTKAEKTILGYRVKFQDMYAVGFDPTDIDSIRQVGKPYLFLTKAEAKDYITGRSWQSGLPKSEYKIVKVCKS